MNINIDILDFIFYNYLDAIHISNVVYSCTKYCLYLFHHNSITILQNKIRLENKLLINSINKYIILYDHISLKDTYNIFDGMKSNPRTDLIFKNIDIEIDRTMVYMCIYKYMKEYSTIKKKWIDDYFYNYPIILSSFDIFVHILNHNKSIKLKITINSYKIKCILEKYKNILDKDYNMNEFIKIKYFLDKYVVYSIMT